MDWRGIVTGVIVAVISTLILKALERSFGEGRLKRALLVAEGVFIFTVIPWLVSMAFFYTKDPAAGTHPVNAENILEALAYIFYTGISPFGRLLMAAGLLTGLALGIWYPDKLRQVLHSFEGKQEPAGAPGQRAKDAADRDGSA
jgi:hypothetical protein